MSRAKFEAEQNVKSIHLFTGPRSGRPAKRSVGCTFVLICFIIYSDFNERKNVFVPTGGHLRRAAISDQPGDSYPNKGANRYTAESQYQRQNVESPSRVDNDGRGGGTLGFQSGSGSESGRGSGSFGVQVEKKHQHQAQPGGPMPTPSSSASASASANSINNGVRMTIETAVFLDQALSSRYTGKSQGLADLNKLVLTIMNQVKYMFQYSSLMKSIDIKLVLVESLKDSERRGMMKYLPSSEQGDIDLYLSNFCQWQQTRLETNKEQLWWDHAILLSGLDLYKASQTGNQSGVLGLSWVGGMCKGNYSCTVGEAIHLESAFVIAHELGHSLGMMHDGNKNNCDPNKYIMSDKTGAGKVNWSRCSNNYLAEALKRNQLGCLNQNSSVSSSTDTMYELTKLKPPGQVYSLNDQCRLAYGGNYSHFISQDGPYNNVCQELWCVSGSWARPVHPALEGSSCDRSQDLGFKCREGKCV